MPYRSLSPLRSHSLLLRHPPPQSLEHVNGQDERRVDDVRETIRALYRVFQLGSRASDNDYPALSKPTGYSGDVGAGPTDAYTALKPKPWKAPA